MHIVESAGVKYTSGSIDDLESRQDLNRLKKYEQFFLNPNSHVDFELGYSNRVVSITRICEQYQADLLIVGSHGHRGVKDFIFGETVNKLRHIVKIPVFIA